MISDAFPTHRNLLFTVAYEILGSAADAEDVLQDTWLRWDRIDQAQVNDSRAYLIRAVTRQALSRLRTRSRRREDYVGAWLPEPLLTSPDMAADLELAESVSVAMLTVLETLGPLERIVFVLREVFATPYDEIASATGKTPAAVRQIAHRARKHVAARRPRLAIDQGKHQEVVARFLDAVRQGDIEALLEVLAPDVVVVADGGGVAPAARRPIHGAARVARALATGLQSAGATFSAAWINGSLGALIHQAEHLSGAVTFEVTGERISHVFAISNPQKLVHLDTVSELTRS